VTLAQLFTGSGLLLVIAALVASVATPMRSVSDPVVGAAFGK